MDTGRAAAEGHVAVVLRLPLVASGPADIVSSWAESFGEKREVVTAGITAQPDVFDRAVGRGEREPVDDLSQPATLGTGQGGTDGWSPSERGRSWLGDCSLRHD